MRFQGDSITHYIKYNGKLQNNITTTTSDSFFFQDTIRSYIGPSGGRTYTKSSVFLYIRPHSTMPILQYPHRNPRLALPKL